MSLAAYKLALIQFNIDLDKIILNIVKKNEGKILTLVKLRLYQKGIDGTGKLITPTYSRSTILEKKKKRQRASFVTLRDTGLFYKGFYLELSNYVLILNSSDSKTSSLIDKYGDAILEFTKQEKDFIIDFIIEPGIQKEIDKLTFNSSSAGSIELDLF